MKIELRKYGDLLISRPAGREAAMVARANLTPKSEKEKFEIDFEGVSVLAPSWIDEFVQGLRETFKNEIVFLSSKNSTVVESLKFLSK